MRTNVHKTAELGDLVVAVFDKAAGYSSDPRQVSRLATGVVLRILRRKGARFGCYWKGKPSIRRPTA